MNQTLYQTIFSESLQRGCSKLEADLNTVQASAHRILQKLKDDGVEVIVTHDLHDISEFLRSKDDKRVWLMPLLNPDFQPSADQRNTLCLFLKKNNSLIGSCCARLKKIERTMAEELEDLSFLYESPETMAPENEACIVTASPAWNVLKKCTVAFLSGGYIDREFSKSASGGFYYDALQRLTRILILIKWDIDYFTSFNEEATAIKVGFNRYGHEGAHPFVQFFEDDQLTENNILMMSSRKHMSRLYLTSDIGALDKPVQSISIDAVRKQVASRLASYQKMRRRSDARCRNSP